MKKATSFSTILTGFIWLSAQSFSQTVIPHPVPVEFLSNKYSVEVNGRPVEVFQARPSVHFASFDFTGEANVKVIGRIVKVMSANEVREQADSSFWKGDAVIRPLSRNIMVKTAASSATFTLIEPGQYSLEGPKTANFDDNVLFLFANRPETERPKPEDPNVIWLKPGIHQQNIDLKSGQTLYLEAGSVLFGGINIWDARDVKILGRGTVFYYGPQSENVDDGKTHRKNWHPLTTHNSERLTVSGITLVARSRTWTIQMQTTYDADFDNVKVLGVNNQDVNGDGFDWGGGGRTRITNSLVRCADDAFAFLTPAPWDGTTKESENKDIRIENCVIWPTRANICRFENPGAINKTDNIVMFNCDIIHVPKRMFQVPRSVVASYSSKGQGSVYSNIIFENVRFEEPAALLGIQNEGALFRNIVFKNISMRGKTILLFVKGTVDGLLFDNVRLDGKMVSAKEDIPFELITKEISNLKFLKTK
jgi:hypothetical protein